MRACFWSLKPRSAEPHRNCACACVRWVLAGDNTGGAGERHEGELISSAIETRSRNIPRRTSPRDSRAWFVFIAADARDDFPLPYAAQLLTENLRFHHDYLLENRRVAIARDALHCALKEQAKLNRELQAERSKSRKLDKENKKLKRQLEEAEQQLRRASGPKRMADPAPHPASTAASSSVLEQLQPIESELIYVDGDGQSNGSSQASASSAAPGSARKRPRTESGEALVGKVIAKMFEGAGMFWGEIIDYDEST